MERFKFCVYGKDNALEPWSGHWDNLKDAENWFKTSGLFFTHRGYKLALVEGYESNFIIHNPLECFKQTLSLADGARKRS